MRSSFLVPFLGALALAGCTTQKSEGAPKPSASATGEAPRNAPASTTASTASSPAASAREPAPMPSAAVTKRLATSSNALGLDLWSRVRPTTGNFAMSPASISIALAMAYGGAEGETATQMQKVLHTEDAPAPLMAAWGTLAKALTDPSRAMKLRIANRLFGEKTATFAQPYLEQTRTAFGAPLEPLDFKTAAEPSRVRINAWVEEQTEKRIKDLLSPNTLDPLTRLVVVNAIYFLGAWQTPFEAAQTVDKPFHASNAKTKAVPTMHQVNLVRVARSNGVQVLELPYKGGTASLLVALPDRADGIAALDASLSIAKLEEWMRGLSLQNVDVMLPRFEVNEPTSLALEKHLAALGMPLAFDPGKADFTGIANGPDPNDRLSIEHVIHKAVVKLDEKGTEAAAATGVVMAARGAGPASKPIEFRADHPFLFFIVDNASGLILFIGRVTEP